ncbi:MAG: hypothetical protein H6R23_2865, partial [Proteobacteria bacterium]|nr:hypothetical protein [Pseudomonadota bacterium]
SLLACLSTDMNLGFWYEIHVWNTTLLGHSDVRTTMIYTHTVRSITLKEAKSPLDF